MRNKIRKITALLLISTMTIPTGIHGAESENVLVINDEAFSLSDFNYYFWAYYESFVQSNDAYISYMFDESKSLKEQIYDETTGQTWFDFFVENTIESLTEVVLLKKEAEEQAVSISDSQIRQIDDLMSAMEDFTAYFQMTPEEYLSGIYGEGMTEEIYREHLLDSVRIQNFVAEKKASFTPDDREIEEYYSENLRDFTTVSYERFYVKASDYGTEPTEAEKAQAKETADNIRTELENGIELSEACEPYADQGAYFSFSQSEYTEGSSYGAWLFSPDRQELDSTVIDDGNGYYVMVFHSRSEEDYFTADILDAFFPLDSSIESTDEQMEDSCERAEAFLEGFKNTDQTEESFREMAGVQADISGSEAEYLSVLKNQFGTYGDRWIFSEDRESGDSAVVYSETGFHVFYYVGEGEAAWRTLVSQTLQNMEYNSWFEDMKQGITVERNEELLSQAAGYDRTEQEG